KGGLDAWLLATANANLDPAMLRLKHQVQRALEKRAAA
ncbi:MAG: 50S ribosomal protein L28, partial [Rhodospirillales bacterium]|nr:50S ribosomal protein L28 [Rhodospirillales bacterium]